MNILETKSVQFIEKAKNAPTDAGCYMYLNSDGEIIYVGKAKILKNRIKSYFSNYARLDLRIQTMITNATSLQYITVDSEFEALILENNLIKKYKPKYNVMLRDDKSYSYIKIEKPIKNVTDYPKIKITREKKNDTAMYFGPFPNNLPLKNILKRIRKVFPFVSCNRKLVEISNNPINVSTNNSTPCLYYHLGLCQAPCASLISKKEYNKNFKNIIKFFEGKKYQIIEELEKEMSLASKSLNYELAAQLRDKINDIKYVTQNVNIDKDVDDVIVEQLKKSQREKAINDLIEELNFPADVLKNHPGFKIECYDISNIQGTNAVGSMTVMVDGILKPNLYRKFKIQRKNTPNDFAMLQEVLTRRFNHFLIDKQKKENNITLIDESFSILPDLIIIDGGKGQLASVYKILKNMGLDNLIPIIGLAKREEEIFKINWQFNNDDFIDITAKRFKRIFLPRKSECLFLVQRIRDEAHRFGITYHRKLRSKQMVKELVKI